MSSTDQHHELPAPHFEDRLWTVLAEAHVQRDRSTGVPHRPERSSIRRGRRLLTAGIGTIAAAAAVIATVSVVGSDGDGDSTTTDRTAPEQGPETPTELDLAAEITAATEEAIADSVVYIIEDSSDDHLDGTEQWSDEASGAWRLLHYFDGAPSLDYGVAAPPAVDAVAPPPLHDDESCPPWMSQTVGEPSELPEVEELPDCQPTIPPDHPMVLNRSVDYCFEEYAEFDVPALPARNEAEFVGEQLANGELVEDGTQVVDGRELIRLRTPGEWSEHTYYVDPETYRPVRSEGYPDDAGVPLYIRTYEYLPRTQENLALLVAPIPEGFTQTDQLPGDGARSDAGCGY